MVTSLFFAVYTIFVGVAVLANLARIASERLASNGALSEFS